VSKNVAVFVDVANIFYAAKAAGVDIDYVTLLKAAVAGRDFVRAYAYTGLDPENESQRNFQQFLARNSYRVISKDIRKYGDGRVKANLDIEMVVDMMKTARNLDVAVLVSGDGDFAPAIRAVQEMGVRVEVICFRANTSSDLIDVADQFIEITQIAKVEKGSARSGRRVAGDEEDLSMTAVPEKQTEGATERRRRTRARAAETEKAERPARRTTSATSRSRAAAVTVLPGEKLSRAAAVADVAEDEEPEAVTEALLDESIDAIGETGETGATEGDGQDATAEGGTRRRRRRRGRGRGRGREAGLEGAESDESAEGAEPPFEEASEPPRRSRHAAFGSVWDSQIGVPSGPRRAAEPPADEDLEEPEVPEYLLAERRGRDRGRGGGRRDQYRSAIERERYGRGGSGRQAEPRGGWSREGRRDHAPRSPRSAEGWSEVPPEIEAMLKAQLATKASTTMAPSAPEREAPAERKPVRRAGAKPAGESGGSAGTDAPAEAPAKKPARRSSTKATTTEVAQPSAEADAPAKKPARRSSTKAAATEGPTTDAEVPAKPARRSRSKTVATD
jgi:uncharacterized LabA/DUF88 family protein